MYLNYFILSVKITGFMGKDEFEEARCNMVLECTEDMRKLYLKTVFGDDASKVRK